MMSKGIGYMPMPEGFQYAELAKAGRPKHEKFDEFWLRHPPMDLNRRAKIFAPFDALKGYKELIKASEEEVRKQQESVVERIPVYDDWE